MLGDQALNDKSKRWVIVMTVAPAVLRVEHGSEKEVVVVKARVLLEEGSPLWEEGSEEESFDDKSSQDTSEGEDGTSDEEGGISNEHDRGGEEHDGASEKDRSSGEDVGNRNARIEKHGECRGGITRDIDMNTGNEEHGVSEEQGIMPETPRNRENNLETEDIEHERASESTGSYEEGVRREAGWSGDERKEEENPERKKTEGEIDKQDEVEEWENRENDGSNEMDGVKEVAGHEAGISGDKTQVDIKVTGNKKGGNVDDKGSCGEEGSTYTADRDAEISPPRASADGMTCHNATERRDNSEKGKYCEDQDSRGDLDKAASNRNNAEQGANFEGGGFEKKGQSCGEEECKSEETLKNEDTESCEEEDKGTQEEGSNTG
ncbi:hypothetical protein BGX38DRAFT_1216837 [Terfezia claveryi]|nr:hypothetical protein BGX38DRAFT_1216837 [Terfezia claveryi]